MRKRILIYLLLALMFLVPSSVNAHSGGTDSNGGHYNGGEYHYHHGYPAHDHDDMDGDGILDCPYDFEDNSKQHSFQSGGNIGSSKSPANERAGPHKEITALRIIIALLTCLIPALILDFLILCVLINIIGFFFSGDRAWKIFRTAAILIFLAIYIALIYYDLK